MLSGVKGLEFILIFMIYFHLFMGNPAKSYPILPYATTINYKQIIINVNHKIYV